MSFSFNCTNVPAPEAAVELAKTAMPASIRAYVEAGLQALQKQVGDDNVSVTISCYGHLNSGHTGGHEETNVNVQIQKGVATEEPPALGG